MNISEVINEVLKTCDIKLEGNIISRELLIKTFGEFISQTIDKNDHNVGLIMHTGSICFDVLIVTFAALTNLVSNQMNIDDIVNSLEIGDLVLYGSTKKERFKYQGTVDGAELGNKGHIYIKLSQKDSVTYIAEKSWRLIEPYNGESNRLDGRGLRRKNTLRDDFYTKVLRYEVSQIPSVIDTSSVVVMDRERAERLVKGISISFEDKEIELLDLLTASYFTEDDEYRFGGNTGKNEPVLKFAGKVSVARDLLISRKGNKHLGIIISGRDSLNRGMSEIPELLGRKSLKYVYLCSAMDFDYGTSIVEDNEDMEVFVCTKDFLLDHTLPDVKDSNGLTNELMRQVNTSIDKMNEVIEIENGFIKWDEYKKIKNDILFIKRNEYTSSAKDSFIIQTYSLLNLFTTAAFPMVAFSRVKNAGVLEVELPSNRIESLTELLSEFPSVLKDRAQSVMSGLQDIQNSMQLSNLKFDWLKKFISSHLDAKIAIVVPKAYYISILREGGLFSSYYFKNVTFFTTGKFDNTKFYDYVIVLGEYEGKRFNAFRCNSAPRIISLLYAAEKKGFTHRMKMNDRSIHALQKKSTILINDDYVDEIAENDEAVVEIDEEIESYLDSLDSINVGYYSKQYSSDSSAMADIVAVASFADDSKAFFSKHYKGYILDESTGEVKEEEPTSFVAGDSIVFTQNNSDTRDIVSSVLAQLILDGKLSTRSVESYKKSQIWKDTLIDYMNSNELNMHEVAERLRKDGVSFHDATIRNWLDEDSHIVGPREVESLRHIGNVTGNEVLSNSPEEIFEACREVRAIRRKILEQIGKAIVHKLSGKHILHDDEFSMIYEKIDSLAVIMQIERITFIETSMPMNMANKPIYS